MRAKLASALLGTVAVWAAVGVPAIAQERTAAVISDIRQENTERSTRLIVECNAPLAYTYYSPDPLTLVIDIPEVDASRVPARLNVGTREVESLRLTNMARADGRNLARLEVRLASLVPYQIYSRDKSLNLLFERPGESAAPSKRADRALTAAEAVVAPASEKTALEKPNVAPEKPAEAAAEAAPPAAATAAPDGPAAREAAALSDPAPGPAKPAARATRILAVTPAKENGQLAVTVRADGRLKYQDFFLGNPDRLVLDFADVTSATLRNLEVNQAPVRKVRLAQFSPVPAAVARLVLDLSSRAPYRIVEGRDGVKILFGEGTTPSPAPLAALREPGPQAQPASPSTPTLMLPAPAVPVPVVVLPEPQAGRENFEPKGVAPPEKKWTGHPISLNFKDGDLQDIFRLFHDLTGLNIVVNPGVTGKVTLVLEEVPWDQALDLILKTQGLGSTLEENVLRIAPLATLQNEEKDRRKLAEEKALAGDLIVWKRRLSYATAAEAEALVKKVSLSSRGSTVLDARTNMLIVTDLPAYVEKAKDVITDLDTSNPQVEIEARIVVTSRNFTRDLGIQWGFNQAQTTEFGNTTNRTFPNSIILNGQGVPGAGIPADQGQAAAVGVGSAGRGYAVNLPASAFNSALGVSMGNILGNFNLDAALTALQRQGRGRLLSTPKITTQNNLEAEIKQGVQIPIQTVANNTVTVQFKDAVLTLKVTPHITDAGTVVLKIEVENNSADFANLVNGIPPINTQSAKTTVLVRDGSTAVIGGIYQSNEQTAQQSTPFLGQVPILGYLFRNRFVRTTNDELLLFITPRITKS